MDDAVAEAAGDAADAPASEIDARAKTSPRQRRGERAPARRRLFRAMIKTISEHELLAPGDHVLVAVSGGKDSYTLLDLLTQARARAPFEFSLTAVHLDQGQPGYDGRPLADWLARFTAARGVPHEILSEDTYSDVVERTPAGKAYCTVCSRLRRGILYTAAARLGCNRIALGHHRDDALETLLMNLFYAGKLQAMPAGYTTDDGRFHVIRPLIECAEADIIEHATAAAYPILPCNLCGSQSGLKREAMKSLLGRLERELNPNLRAVMLSALKRVHPSHLLDRPLQARLAGAAEPTTPSDTPPRPRRLPVVS